MKKNSFIAFIISLVIVSIVILFNYMDIIKQSTLTCINDDDDKIVFVFNENGITKFTKNGKLVSDKEKKIYNIAMASSFTWNKMNGTYSEIIKKHMRDMKDYYEEKNEFSYCNYREY